MLARQRIFSNNPNNKAGAHVGLWVGAFETTKKKKKIIRSKRIGNIPNESLTHVEFTVKVSHELQTT